MHRMTCPRCGEIIVTTSQLDPSQIHCPKCKKPMASAVQLEYEQAPPGYKHCVYCASCIPSDSNMCTVCGYAQTEPQINLHGIENATRAGVEGVSEGRLSQNNLHEIEAATAVPEQKKLSFGVGLLCFFLPFLGVLLWLIDLGKNPRRAGNELLLSVFPTLIWIVGIGNAMNETSDRSALNSTGNSATLGVNTPTFEEWMTDEFEPYNVTSIDVVGGTVIIHFNVSNNISDDMVVGGAEADVMYMLKDIDESDYDYSSVRIVGSFPMIDQYGNTENTDVVDLRYSKSTLDEINWSSFLYTNTFEIADSRNIHPAFQQ